MTEERRDVLVSAVGACKSQILLDEVFQFYGIADDANAKMSVLLEAMGDPALGFCGSPDNEERFKTLSTVFLSGTWQENGGQR
jgi:hypothetical protein